MTNAVEIVSTPIPENEPIPDPFASDLFGSNGKANMSEPLPAIGDSEEPSIVVSELKHLSSWTARLPKISRKLLESSFWDEKLPSQLPDSLAKALEEALGEIVFAESDPARCRLESIVECDLFAESADRARAGNLAIQILFEPTQSCASVMIEGSFVHRLIDKIFGPSGYEPTNKVSPIEMAIAEFLAARVVARINDSLGDEFFSVGEASLTPSELFSEHEVGAKACLEVKSESFVHRFQVLASRGFLSGLKKIDSTSDSEADERKAVKLFQTMLSVPLRAQIGTTRLEAATLSFLEPGDVVIVEESQLAWDHGSPQGTLRLLAGAGTNVVLTGELTTDKNAGGMRVLVKDISSREVVNDRHTNGFIMEDIKPDEIELEEASQEAEQAVEAPESNEISASVGNLQLRLRVELAGNKMSLREINSLRVGQVIDLGRGPTDSVNLVTDGSDETVAVGELVDIEGRLGVRLTKVFI